ncbi:MAG: GxxExxY protein [Bacteroidales bacterium]|jgi:GxxExxY protein|nr:GxxExxY protein [Bacteroidales bacterium]MBR2200108.1 GxxExxY protein [Bacteroidales bacterium]MBR4273357.1 GxxExxY protein [Bacteroidales bacterium]
MDGLLYKDESYKIVGAMMAVHNDLGCGFLESVYQEALEVEFKLQGIPFEREKAFDIYYKGVKLSKKFVADFVCFDKIIVELKAVDLILPEFEAQTLNYMKITNFKLGIIVNFGKQRLETKRLVRMQGW